MRAPSLSALLEAAIRWNRERHGRAGLASRRKALVAWVAQHPGWRLTDCDDQQIAFAVAQLVDTRIDEGLVLAGPGGRLIFEVRSEPGWVTAGVPVASPSFLLRIDRDRLVAQGPGSAGLTAALLDGLSPAASLRGGGGWLRYSEQGAMLPETVDALERRLDDAAAAVAAAR